MAFTKPTVKVPNVSTKVKVTAAIFLAVVSLLFLTAIYQRHQNVVHAQAVAKHDAALAEQKNIQTKLSSLQAQVASEHTKRMNVCNYVTLKSKTKPTAGLITLPVVDCQP